MFWVGVITFKFRYHARRSPLIKLDDVKMKTLPRFRASACALSLACLTACTAAPEEPETVLETRTSQEIVDASASSDWRTLDPDKTLYLDLDSGRVVIELTPDFAPEHFANVRLLAQEGYWDGQAIYRVQDNYVVQFGADPSADPPHPLGSAKTALPAEFERSARDLPFHALPDHDGWAAQTGFSNGFPAARDSADGTAWLTHCYGMLGAGRSNAPDSSIGTELYVVIGQSPRHLDRNVSLLGRVVKGMELLSTLPRGTGRIGFYEHPAQFVPIQSIRLAADVPEDEREALEILRTDTPLFDAFVESRRNRRDAWTARPAGHVDICNLEIPIRALRGPLTD